MAELELSLEVQVLVAPTEADVKSIARRIADLPSSKRGEVRQDILEAVRSDDGGHSIPRSTTGWSAHLKRWRGSLTLTWRWA